MTLSRVRRAALDELEVQCPHCQAALKDCTRCVGEPLQRCAIWCSKNDVLPLKRMKR